VRQKLESLIDETHADELMIVSGIYDHAERLRSYEIVSELSKAVSEREVGTARR
jgi:ribosome biogenesis SPOUT family RNA methylase Rps3